MARLARVLGVVAVCTCTSVQLAGAQQALLASGAMVSTAEWGAAPGPGHGTPHAGNATIYYSGQYQDNLVAATAATATAAARKGYGVIPPAIAVLAAKPAATGRGAGSAEEHEHEHAHGHDDKDEHAEIDTIELKTFWSASLNDTLTTGSAKGLAWAADPQHGYVFQRVEGYCLAAAPPLGGAVKSVVHYVQLWSAVHNDSFMVAVGGPHETEATWNKKYSQAWSECFVGSPSPPAPKPVPSGGTGRWTTWANKPQTGIPWPRSEDLIGWEFLSGANPAYGGNGRGSANNSADTWYPSWAADGNLYTSWTDGVVTDDEAHVNVTSHSWAEVNNYNRSTAGPGSEAGKWLTSDANATTGQAVISGDDPFHLKITEVATFASHAYPYESRYACGTLYYNHTWFYGTYYLSDPNSTVASSYVGPNPPAAMECGNWCIQGPLVDFRYSTDRGRTWAEPRMNATNASDNLFAESAANNGRVKFGAPHWVDFGQELAHSPDGKAYLVGHGASSPSSVQAWMLGDEVYMARVSPTIADVGDKANWEFYAGGHGDTAVWVKGDVSAARPLVSWDHHTGVVTMTYFPALEKYVLSISTSSAWPSMVGAFDTYFLESDSITGPWSYVNYNAHFGTEAYFVHHPSKFLAQRANTSAAVYDCFLMYSANFAHGTPNPPNSGYHLNLQQSRFKLSASFSRRLDARYTAMYTKIGQEL